MGIAHFFIIFGVRKTSLLPSCIPLFGLHLIAMYRVSSASLWHSLSEMPHELAAGQKGQVSSRQTPKWT